MASHSAYAGDLDGIETLIGIAIALFGLTMLCWIVALVNTIRFIKNKPYAEKYLGLVQTVLVLVSIFVMMLYQGKMEVQIFGSLFFLAPVIIHIVGVYKRPK